MRKAATSTIAGSSGSLTANTMCAVAYLRAFVYQTLYLTLDSIGDDANTGSNPAFTPGEFPLSYGLVALGIFGAGVDLVALGHVVRARRIARTDLRTAAVERFS